MALSCLHLMALSPLRNPLGPEGVVHRKLGQIAVPIHSLRNLFWLDPLVRGRGCLNTLRQPITIARENQSFSHETMGSWADAAMSLRMGHNSTL